MPPQVPPPQGKTTKPKITGWELLMGGLSIFAAAFPLFLVRLIGLAIAAIGATYMVYRDKSRYRYPKRAIYGVVWLAALVLFATGNYIDGAFWHPPSPSGPQVISNNQSGGITAGRDVTINNYIQQKSDELRARHTTLMQAYPIGYALLAMNEKEIRIPDSFNFLDEYDVSWDKTNVSRLTPNAITITVDLHHKPTNAEVRNTRITIPRRVGFFTLSPPLDLGGSSLLYFELLEDDGDAIIIVIGAKPRRDG